MKPQYIFVRLHYYIPDNFFQFSGWIEQMNPTKFPVFDKDGRSIEAFYKSKVETVLVMKGRLAGKDDRYFRETLTHEVNEPFVSISSINVNVEIGEVYFDFMADSQEVVNEVLKHIQKVMLDLVGE